MSFSFKYTQSFKATSVAFSCISLSFTGELTSKREIVLAEYSLITTLFLGRTLTLVLLLMLTVKRVSHLRFIMPRVKKLSLFRAYFKYRMLPLSSWTNWIKYWSLPGSKTLCLLSSTYLLLESFLRKTTLLSKQARILSSFRRRTFEISDLISNF